MIQRHSTYSALFSSLADIERGIGKDKKVWLAKGNAALAILEGYLTSDDREFESSYEVGLLAYICARRLAVVDSMFVMEKPAIAAIREYQQRAEAALSAADMILGVLYKDCCGNLDEACKHIALQLKHERCSYHASLLGLYARQC
jgi:hypothetical protein